MTITSRQSKKFVSVELSITAQIKSVGGAEKELSQAKRRLQVAKERLSKMYRRRKEVCHHPTTRKEYGAPEGYAYVIKCNACQGVLEMPREELPSRVESDRKLDLRDSYG